MLIEFFKNKYLENYNTSRSAMIIYKSWLRCRC